MTKSLFAMVFSCLMIVGLAGCGSGGDDTADLVSDMCNKMDSCGYLKDTGMTVSDCKKLADTSGGKAPTTAEKDAARACIAKSCTEFMTCSNDL
jgi:hypothetical protein